LDDENLSLLIPPLGELTSKIDKSPEHPGLKLKLWLIKTSLLIINLAPVITLVLNVYEEVWTIFKNPVHLIEYLVGLTPGAGGYYPQSKSIVGSILVTALPIKFSLLK